jgi:hypothetical protein
VSLEEEVALLLRQFHCKQQRIYKALPWRAPSRETRATGLATGAARSGIGDPPIKKEPPEGGLVRDSLHVRRDGEARHSHANARRCGAMQVG